MTLQRNVVDLPIEIIEDLKAQSECIRNVNLTNFDRMKSIQTLSVLRNITQLVITNYQHKNDVLGVIDMPNLSYLELIKSIPFAEVIGSQSLRTLKIYGKNDTRNRFADEYSDLNGGFNNFLSKCHNLKDLTLSNIRITNLNLKNESFEFNLESLTIEDLSFNEENFVEFLIKHKNSLKKLAILNDLPKPIILQIMFSQLTLDELEIDVSIIHYTFNPQIINRTIKKLTIRSTMNQNIPNFIPGVFVPQNINLFDIILQLAYKKIISTCEAVEEFISPEYSCYSFLPQINRNLKDLKVLRLKTIPNFVTSIITTDKFKTLEVIEIDQMSALLDIKNCTSVVLNSPNLKALKINSMERNIFTSNFFIKIITKSKNLREIHIGVRCIFTLDMINAVKEAKDLGHPLESISFLFCLIDDKIDKNDTFMDGLKLNFQQNLNKFFSSMINETKLGRMKREIDEKHKDIEHQKICGAQRKLQVEKYDRKLNL